MLINIYLLTMAVNDLRTLAQRQLKAYESEMNNTSALTYRSVGVIDVS